MSINYILRNSLYTPIQKYNVFHEYLEHTSIGTTTGAVIDSMPYSIISRTPKNTLRNRLSVLDLIVLIRFNTCWQR
jgi:hypothetical protein